MTIFYSHFLNAKGIESLSPLGCLYKHSRKVSRYWLFPSNSLIHPLHVCVCMWMHTHTYTHTTFCTSVQFSSVAQSCPTFCLQLHGMQPARLLCPWGFSRQEYWSGLPHEGIFPIQGSSPGLSHCRQILYHLSHERSLFYFSWSTLNSGFCRSKVIESCDST